MALTTLEADDKVLAAVRAGVQGYVNKTTPPEELVEAVRAAHRGELVFPAALTRFRLPGGCFGGAEHSSLAGSNMSISQSHEGSSPDFHLGGSTWGTGG